MQDQLFSIIDVETTGNGILGNRITEICIVVMTKGKILNKFTTLVNPQQAIPQFITGLTGIDDQMVRKAPVFEDIADQILEMTKGAVFVAHNVNFDYHVLREEFKRIGIPFVRKKLCTVRLSRKLIPGLVSYSLGKLCSSLQISIHNRHRAEGDTDATVQLFQYILEKDPTGETVSRFLNARSKEATLPPHIDKNVIYQLPEEPGIYFFKSRTGKVIYVGKAKNIKNRVLGHFYDKKNSEYALAQHTFSVDYETTGNELIALLLESEQIQKFYPRFNKAQKRLVKPFCIIGYQNRRGIHQLAIERSHALSNAYEVFYNHSDVVARLEQLCIDFQLCPRFCSLQQTNQKCFHYKIKDCLGICQKKESVALYNMRVQKALHSLQLKNQNYIIKGRGRSNDEQSFILVREGLYRGYGFIANHEQITSYEELEPFVHQKKHTYYTSKIIQGYLNRAPDHAVVRFSGDKVNDPYALG